MRKLPYDHTFKNKAGDELTLRIWRCDINDLDDVYDLQNEVYLLMRRKDFYVGDTMDELAEALENDYCFAAYDGHQIVAATLLIGGRVTDLNLGTEIGYSDSRLKETATMEFTLVMPEYRGFGIQRHFVDLREEVVRELGLKEALTIISPDNTYSLNNLIASGYEILTESGAYDGRIRYILRKEY